MKAKAFLVTALLFVLSVAAIASEGRDVTYKSGNESVHGMLYMPKGDGPFPALVVIHEWWGLNDWVKEQAADLAAHGYDALAVDLYRGQVADDADTAHQLSRGLPQDRGILARLLLAPPREGQFAWHEVSTRVNRVANDDAQLVLPITEEQREAEEPKPATKAGLRKPAPVASDDGQGSLF